MPSPLANEADASPLDLLADAIGDSSDPRRSAARSIVHDVGEIDRALYRAVATTSTPALDRPLRRLSRAANSSRLWLGVAAVLYVFGGRRGKRAAATGAVALAVDSALVNLALKPLGRRERPARETAGVPLHRHVPMPTSTSFPSGHSASAFAFALAVSSSHPHLGLPLRVVAMLVAYSRVHTGVHYPSDVVVGSLIGASIGEATALTARLLRRRASAR